MPNDCGDSLVIKCHRFRFYEGPYYLHYRNISYLLSAIRGIFINGLHRTELLTSNFLVMEGVGVYAEFVQTSNPKTQMLCLRSAVIASCLPFPIDVRDITTCTYYRGRKSHPYRSLWTTVATTLWNFAHFTRLRAIFHEPFANTVQTRCLGGYRGNILSLSKTFQLSLVLLPSSGLARV